MPDTKRYARLKALLQEKITSGAYQAGDRFFSQNELMRKYGLSFSTVIRALDELVADGYLIRKQGKGTYIASTEPAPRVHKAPEKHVTIFAPWHSAASNSFGQINAAEFYRRLDECRPDWMHLRLVPTGAEAEALERWLFSKETTNVALALYPSAPQVKILQKMAEQHPVVAITDDNAVSGISCIITSFADAAAMAACQLIVEGHTTIGLVLPTDQNAAAAACLKGYRQALREASYPFGEGLMSRCRASDPTGYHAVLQLFDSNSSLEITSLVVAGSALLPGALYAAEAMNRTAPAQLSIVCIDDQQVGSELGDKVTRVVFPADNIAEAALARVMEALAPGPPQFITVAPQLIPAAPPQRAK